MYKGKKIAWISSGDNAIATVNDRVQLICEGLDKGMIVVVDSTKKLKLSGDINFDEAARFIAELVDALTEE
jgi:hypothetical protein